MESRTSKARSSKSGGGSTRVSSSASRKVRKSKKSSSSSTKTQQGRRDSPGGTDVTASASTSDENTPRRSPRQRRKSGESSSSSSSSSAGCCTSFVVGALHVMDIGLGVACVLYGGMVHVVSVTAISISYGLVLVLGSIAGTIGYCSSGGASRRTTSSPGLMASGCAGFITSLMDVAAFVGIMSSWNPFIEFLKDNEEALLLTESSIDTIQGLEVPLAIIFIVLACLEMYRGIAMCRMKKTKSSSSPQRLRGHLDSISVNSDTQPKHWLLSWLGIVKKKRTDDLVVFDDNSSLESALLWSNDGEPCPEDYLVFVPEHEKSLTNFTASISLPAPPEDKTDY